MKSTKLLILPLVLISFGAFSQAYVTQGQTNIGTGPIAVFSLNEPLNKEIDGNPYYSKKFKPGKIILSTGKELEVDRMNYNIHIDKISYKNEDAVFNTADNLNIEEFYIDDVKFIYSLVGNRNRPEVFEVLADGEVKLLKKHHTNIRKGKPSNGYNDATKDRYILYSEYYFKKGDLPAEKFNDKDKEVLTILADKKKELEKHMDDKRLNAKKEKELIKIFNYYNSL